MFLRHLPKRRLHPLQSLGHSRRTFQRPLRSYGRALTQVGGLPPLPEDPKPPLGQRIKAKIILYVQVFFGFIALGIVVENTPSWQETLDAISRVIGPNAVSSISSSAISNIVYNPPDQDPPTHQPITLSNEFRVLIVEPGSGTEEVRCRMVNVTKSWRTRYDALSYHWGDESLRETIIVEGLRTSITKNLYSALVHLRDPARQRLLWVDALCINQDDPEERGRQVKKMGSIYLSARNVIIWLGEQTEEVQGAFSLIQGKDDKSTPTNWSPVFSLLRRPWFQRTWVIQEAVLAREPVLACGLETMPWTKFSTWCVTDQAQGVLPDNDPEVAQALRAVEMITHGRYEYHTKHIFTGPRRRKRGRKKVKYTPDFGLVTTLYETRGFQCKDKRDKIFGVLSLVTNVGPEDEVLGPNYRASIEEVLQTVAMWDVRKNESLELLSYCSRKEWTHPKLPSWVPDFSDMDESNSISFLRKMDKPYRGRLQKSKPKTNPGFENENAPSFYIENNKTVLVVTGRVVDTVARVGQVIDLPKMVTNTTTKEGEKGTVEPNEIAVSKRRDWFSECVQIALAADPASSKEPESVANFWKSPNLGMTSDQFDRFPMALTLGKIGSGEDICGYAKNLYRGLVVDPSRDQSQKQRTVHKYMYRDMYKEMYKEKQKKAYDDAYKESYKESYKELAHKRRFCATKTGRLGWIPGAAKEGDLVCEVSGAQVPIILRKMPAADRYMVVGDAYVDGLMPKSTETFYIGGERLWIV